MEINGNFKTMVESIDTEPELGGLTELGGLLSDVERSDVAPRETSEQGLPGSRFDERSLADDKAFKRFLFLFLLFVLPGLHGLREELFVKPSKKLVIPLKPSVVGLFGFVCAMLLCYCSLRVTAT